MNSVFLRALRLAWWAGPIALAAPRVPAQADPPYIRGDANSDGEVDISDGIHVLNYLFIGGPSPRCPAIADANASGSVDISDGIAILSFLFSSAGNIPPLTETEIQNCISPPPPTVLRCGSFGTDGPQPTHGVSGCVEHLSDGTIRLSNFFYDGGGVPRVVVYLQQSWVDTVTPGIVISPDLIRTQPYVGETLSFRMPPSVTVDQFRYVSIWCDYFPLHYAVARLRNPPCFSPCTPSQ
jgi:hypothetical protein